MMKLTATRRDLIFLILLIVMIKVALNKKQVPQTHPIIYAPANHIYDHDDFDSYQQEKALPNRDAHISDLERTQEEEAEEMADEQASGDMSIALATDTEEKNVIHQPDKHIMHHLNTLFDQLDDVLTFVDAASQEVAQLKGVKQRLLHLKRTYQHTSPAIVLLGPIGSAGIVFKEQKLEKELLSTAHRLGTMLCQIVDKEKEFEPAETIAQAIENNRTLLAELQKKDVV